MDVSYNKFYKMLIDRKMKKKDICEQSLASGSVENPLAD